MTPAGADPLLVEEPIAAPAAIGSPDSKTSRAAMRAAAVPLPVFNELTDRRRRTPRKSLILVLPENHVFSADAVADRLSTESEPELVDVILACAGQPTGIAAIQRRVRDLQVLLAPAGTNHEDLRELAMAQAPGDIVTLLNGTPSGG
jgi:hypothetical protein